MWQEFLGLLLLLIVLVSSSERSVSHETALRKKLLSSYDKVSLPNIKTELEVGFSILGINLDEEREMILLDSWIRLQWNDPRLKWVEKDHPDIKNLNFPAESIWMPELVLYNSANWETTKFMTDPLVLAYPNGRMLTVPTAVIQATCTYDMTYWPHDIQNCTARIGSWVYHSMTINFTHYRGNADLEFDIEDISDPAGSQTTSLSRGQMEVKESSVKIIETLYKCCPGIYHQSININLILERKAPLYNWIVKVPALVLAILTGVLFLFPPEYNEKMTFGALLILADLIYLFFLTSIVKHSPSHTPLIVKFAGEQMIFTLIAVVLCCFIVRITKSPHKDTLPRIVNKLVNVLQKPLFLSGYYVAVRSHRSFNRDTGNFDREEEPMVKIDGLIDNFEWILLGAVIDRILLLLYLVIFFIRLAAYASIF